MYGPFDKDGSNCSRFVRDIVLEGKHRKATVLNRIKRVTPSPLGNVYFMGQKDQVYYLNGSTKKLDKVTFVEPFKKLFGSKIHYQPFQRDIADVKNSFPRAQWLDGIGAGAWFDMEQKQNAYYIKRIDQDGSLVYDLPFKSNYELDLSQQYSFKYGTNAMQAIVEQNGREIKMDRF
ncbi:MAG: DUF6695 family protein [Bacteroidota bacterium]